MPTSMTPLSSVSAAVSSGCSIDPVSLASSRNDPDSATGPAPTPGSPCRSSDSRSRRSPCRPALRTEPAVCASDPEALSRVSPTRRSRLSTATPSRE